jgi:hypothetical protein
MVRTRAQKAAEERNARTTNLYSALLSRETGAAAAR